MDTQPIANRCPKCQAPLPPDAPQGLCPKCLFAAVATPTEADQPAGHRPAPPALTEIAAAFPQLEILEFIGQGGMGFVFKARQPKLDRLVALKILPQSLATDPTFAERFNREAKLLARLSHPGIVTVHDFGVALSEGRAGSPLPAASKDDWERHARSDAPYQSQSQFYYLLMEFVDGVNLRQAMQAGRFTPDQALAIVPKICEALQFAHNEGILHRDIKPENILLDAKGRVKIADFGIAKLVAGRAGSPLPAAESNDTSGAHGVTRPTQTNLTEAGKTLGSPNYMAPEQLENPGEVDQRADIYSLGVVFYEMLTGELPLGRFAPPSQKSAADPRVDEVVLRALEKKRERRQHSAGEVRTQVETITATPPGSSRGEEAHSEKSEIGNRKSEMSPRFSRTAIVGMIVPALIFALAAGIVGVPRPAGGLTMPMHSLIGISAIALLGMCILGCGAVSQIRRSAGMICGLPLAFGEAILFPLLAVDGVVFLVCNLVAIAVHGDPELSNRNLAVFFTSAIVLSLIADFFIIRAVWRAVNKGGAGVPLGGNGRESAQTERERRKAESGRPGESLVTSAATNQAPRFSRTAIIGSAWLTLFFAVVPAFLWHEMTTHEFEKHGPLSSPLMIFVFFVFILPSFTAPFGTTILGWIAVAQIRRSAGKHYGLWLAVFDGLLFPLLVLDALIIGLNVGLVLYAFSQLDVPASTFLFFLGVLPTLGAVPVIDFFIIRHIWRAVNQPLAGAVVSPVIRGKTDSAGKVMALVGGVLAAGVIMVLLLGAGLLWSWKHATVRRESAIQQQQYQEALAQQRADLAQERAEESLIKVRTASNVSTDTETNIIPTIDFHDVPLLTAIETLARQMRLNYAINPKLEAELTTTPVVSIRWEKLTARQALMAILDSRDLQLIENPQTGVAQIMKKTADVSPQPQNSTPVVTQNLSFGPVVERVLNEVIDEDCALDLDTGNLLTPPQNVLKQFTTEKWNEHYGNRDHADWKEMQDWARSSGADLICSPSEIGQLKKEGPTLLNSYKTAEGADYWTMSAINLVRLINKKVEFDSQPGGSVGNFQLGRGEPGTTTTLNKFNDQLPQTFAFETREGSQGVLQITGFTENPSGVKLRYKLVKDIAGPKPITASASSDNLEEAVRAIEAFGGGVVRDAAGRAVKVHLIYARHDAHDNAFGDSLNTNTSDIACQWFPAFKDAQQLMLYRGQATDRAMRFVAEMTNLTFLGMTEAQVTDDGLRPITNLVQLREIWIPDCNLTDHALPCFSSFPILEKLCLAQNDLSDDGLRSLTNLIHLKYLSLGGSHGIISDDGVRRLNSLTNLVELDLQDSHLTDAGLGYLERLTNLCYLNVGGTLVSKDGVLKLENAIPGLRIEF